jgi:hypothetical protein
MPLISHGIDEIGILITLNVPIAVKMTDRLRVLPRAA